MANRNKRIKTEEKDDRSQSAYTYQLPDLAITLIISHLSLKHLIKASLLSKEWQTFCSSNPVLYIDEFEDEDESHETKTNNDPKKRRQFFKLLTSYLKFHEKKTHLDKLRLRMRYRGYDSTIKNTLSFAVERNIKELDICFETSDVKKAKSPPFRLRQTLLAKAKSLTILKLENLHIDEDELLNPLTFPSLKTMSLKNVTFTIDRYGFSKLCSRCPRLENVSLISCRDWDVRLANPMLNQLEILRCEINLRLEEDSITNLETFKFRNDHVPREHVMKSFYVDSSPTLRTLEFDHTYFPDGWFESFGTRFPCIEKLVLRECTSYKSVINISSETMTSFEIHDDFKIIIFSDFNLDAPNLTEAAIRIESKRKYLVKMEKMCAGLVRFLGNFRGCKKLRLRVDKMWVFPARMRERYAPPLASVERLEVEIDNVTSYISKTMEAQARSAVVDSLRWMAPSLEFLLINGNYYIHDGKISF